MRELEFTVADVKDLMNAFSKNKLGSMEIEQGSFKLKLEAGGVAAHSVAVCTSTAEMSGAETSNEEEMRGNVVKSPIVGTFYAAPAPDKAPFIETGSKVKKGDVLFIIESMKLMNEVTSELDGTVRGIHVKNGDAVEYGQPILTIE